VRVTTEMSRAIVSNSPTTTAIDIDGAAGVSSARFPPDNVADTSDKLSRVLEFPTALPKMTNSIPSVPLVRVMASRRVVTQSVDDSESLNPVVPPRAFAAWIPQPSEPAPRPQSHASSAHGPLSPARAQPLAKSSAESWAAPVSRRLPATEAANDVDPIFGRGTRAAVPARLPDSSVYPPQAFAAAGLTGPRAAPIVSSDSSRPRSSLGDAPGAAAAPGGSSSALTSPSRTRRRDAQY
jgi:hypothetical protein